MRLPILIFLVMLVTGCDSNSGGGIAGASWDPKNDIIELENYQGYISSALSERIIKNQCYGRSQETWAGIAQHFNDIFRSFTFNIERLESNSSSIPSLGIEVSFKDREFLARKDGTVLIREKLPSAFITHPMRLGVASLDGVAVIMVVTKTRASTGRYFVALYSQDGTLLYRNVLIAWQVWDIDLNAKNINIKGCGETRKITWKNPA